MAKTFFLLPEIGGAWEPMPNRKRFTRQECEFLEQSELLTERYELIDGEILVKMPQNPPHALTVMLLTAWLMRVFGELYARCQLAIDVGAIDPELNNPEPDGVALAQPVTAFATHHPGAADILLLVEVSDTTLRFDLSNKALLYARLAIVEYWISDIGNRRLIIHRNPTPTGYAEVTQYGEDETVSPLARPDARTRVSDLLPPAPS